MACRFDPIVADSCIGIGMGENQSLLLRQAGSTAAKAFLLGGFGGRFSEHAGLPRLLELASVPDVPRHRSLYRPAGSRTLDLHIQSALLGRNRMPADWTRTVSHSTGASDSLGDVSALGAWWHHPLGL